MNKLNLAAIGIVLLLDLRAGYAAQLHAAVKDQHGKPVADAVVLVAPVDPKTASHARSPLDAVDQVDKQFLPYVKAVYVGSKVRFPNKDNIRHQVYSFSAPKEFELPLYAGSEAPPGLFDKPGVVVLGCNIHDWMIGYIYVSETPFFATTDAAGAAALEDLPAGEYLVRVWHPGMQQAEEATVKRMNLNAGDAANVEWQLAVKAALRVPRVSGAANPGYP
jgi:plastocyanin